MRWLRQRSPRQVRAQDLALPARPALALGPQRAERRRDLHADQGAGLVASPSRRAAASTSARCPRWPSVGRSRRRRARGRGGTGRGRRRPSPTRPVSDWVRRIRPMTEAASSICMASRSRPRLVTCGAPATAAISGDGTGGRRAASALGMQVRVGIDHADELVPGLAKAGVEPVGLAAVDRVADRPAARIAPGRLRVASACRRSSRRRGRGSPAPGNRRRAPR